ncbi:uncharacterized protein WM294_015451 [Sarcoramphus papa]
MGSQAASGRRGGSNPAPGPGLPGGAPTGAFCFFLAFSGPEEKKQNLRQRRSLRKRKNLPKGAPPLPPPRRQRLPRPGGGLGRIGGDSGPEARGATRPRHQGALPPRHSGKRPRALPGKPGTAPKERPGGGAAPGAVLGGPASGAPSLRRDPGAQCSQFGEGPRNQCSQSVSSAPTWGANRGIQYSQLGTGPRNPVLPVREQTLVSSAPSWVADQGAQYSQCPQLGS